MASVEEICKFLEERGVDNIANETLRTNKMDGEAVNASTDEMLKSMGLKALGDILALRAFIRRGNSQTDSHVMENNNVKAQLVAAIRHGHKIEKSSKNKFTVNVGLRNFNEKLKKFTYVKCTGGARKFSLARYTTMGSVQKHLHNIYFPDNRNPVLGSLSLYETFVGNISGNKLRSELTLDDYVKANNLTHIRIYLKTKKISRKVLIKKLQSTSHDGDDDDDFVELPNFHRYEDNITSTDQGSSVSISVSPSQSGLIGSTADRKRLREEMDRAFNESLEADRKNSNDKQQNAQDEKVDCVLEENREAEEHSRLSQLMNDRKLRVMPEPALVDPHVTISIRHPIIGNKTRLFCNNAKFTQVYDWVGGQSLRPEHFTLYDFQNKVTPDEKVYSGIFNVRKEDKPMPMTPEGTVAFRGFGTINILDEDDVKTSTIKNEEEHNINLEYPANSTVLQLEFESLQELRELEFSKLNGEPVVFDVTRENVFNELLGIFKKRRTISHKVVFCFSGEKAVGDGISKDCYSEFFEKLFEKMDGVTEKVPLDNSIEEEDLEVIGNIIHHAFIQFGIFPLQLCKSTLKKLLLDHVDKQQLLSSFMNFVTPYESDMILRFSKGEETNEQPVIDVLHSCKVYEKPTAENVLNLCLKGANFALISQPYFPMKYIIKGMGPFWQKPTGNMIDSLYATCTPTADSIIDQIIPNETCPQDQIITTYLHRFIRSSSPTELLLLVRFVTGSTSILPTAKIKLEFIDQSPQHLYPLAKHVSRYSFYLANFVGLHIFNQF